MRSNGSSWRPVRSTPLLRDDEFRTLGLVILGAASCLTLILWHTGFDGSTLRPAVFQTLSILTTTGDASVDCELWTDQAKVVILALMFIGGCAGSAAGGPKVLCHLLVGRYTLLELRRTLHPRGVLPVKLGGKVVSDEIMRGVLVFFLFYILTFAVCTAVVIGCGADIVTGFTATIATLGNIGPRVGSGRVDGKLRPPAPHQQSRPDARHVGRSAGGTDRARPATV